MKNGSSRTKTVGGIVYGPAEEHAVESINAEMRVVNGARLAIGRIVDELVQERGDESRYGEDTLGLAPLLAMTGREVASYRREFLG